MATRNMLERANLCLEGYFRALYVPFGGSTDRERPLDKILYLHVQQ